MQASINSYQSGSPVKGICAAKVSRATTLASIVLLSMMNTVHAASDGRQGGGHRGPPQEAIDACVSLTDGDACSFTGRNDESMSGVCFAPQNKDLACKPEGHEQRGGGGRESGGPPSS